MFQMWNFSALSKEIDEKKKLRDQLAAQKRDLEKALKQRNVSTVLRCTLSD